jgi:hypothetical protein
VEAPFREQFREIRIGEPTAEVPADGQRDHVGWEAVAGEGRGAVLGATLSARGTAVDPAPLPVVSLLGEPLALAALALNPSLLSLSANSIPDPGRPQRNHYVPYRTWIGGPQAGEQWIS